MLTGRFGHFVVVDEDMQGLVPVIIVDPDIIKIIFDDVHIELPSEPFHLKIEDYEDELKSWRIWMEWCREIPSPRSVKRFPLFHVLRQAASPIWRPARRERGHAVGHSPRRRARC